MEAPATIPLNGRTHDTTKHTHSPIVIFPSFCGRSKFFRKGKVKRLPYCGGPLHYANYWRKPRGGPPELQEVFKIRFSLCCGRKGCRRRTMPSSVRFWGRRVYWAPVLMLVTALRQRRNPDVTLERLKGLCGIWRSTVNRWRDYFLNVFPTAWSRHPLSGRIGLQASDRLLHDVLNSFSRNTQNAEAALVNCLLGLAQGP